MRLIDATKIEQYILNNCSDNEEINAIYAEIINAPTIEAEPIRHGQWIDHTYKYRYPVGRYECSICGAAHDMEWGYCPNCGAKMDEENKDNDSI